MIEWGALGEETVDILQRYLRIDTTNPPGNELEGARFLEDVLRRIHGNDERVSIENLVAGARSFTELLLAVAAA